MTEKKKKVVALDKSIYKVEDGKVVIASEELANAIQNQGLDLFVDEEAGAVNSDELAHDNNICW